MEAGLIVMTKNRENRREKQHQGTGGHASGQWYRRWIRCVRSKGDNTEV